MTPYNPGQACSTLTVSPVTSAKFALQAGNMKFIQYTEWRRGEHHASLGLCISPYIVRYKIYFLITGKTYTNVIIYPGNVAILNTFLEAR